MLLCDVNVLVYAHREDVPDHASYRSWLEDLLASDAAYAYSELVLSGFLRVVTHPRVFTAPSPLREAFAFVEALRAQPNAVPVAPGVRHWSIFLRLCDESGARGNLVPDAYHAALAIETGCEWISTDRDYARFNGLRWRHPFDP